MELMATSAAIKTLASSSLEQFFLGSGRGETRSRWVTRRIFRQTSEGVSHINCVQEWPIGPHRRHPCLAWLKWKAGPPGWKYVVR